MILQTLEIAGFGRLSGRRDAFAPGLNVVYGPNESGKSTLAAAIVATLYGAERRKEQWRPWDGSPFATTLTYWLTGGDEVEVRREFDRDAKGLRVYDRNGNERSGSLGERRVSPGEAHLGVPLEVFVNAACIRQQEIAIDEGRAATSLAMHLARALDGGPREDAALGALTRLEDAYKRHVGTDRARKNAPLRDARLAADAARAARDEARQSLAALDALRERHARAVHEGERLAAQLAEEDRRLRSLRAGAIVRELAVREEYHAELAELQAERAKYDDVAGFHAARASELDDAFAAWDTARAACELMSARAEAARLPDAERNELAARRADVGSLDAAAHESLCAAHARTREAHDAAARAARAAAAVRVEPAPPPQRDIALVAGIIVACLAIGFAVAHAWTWTGAALLLTAAALARTASGAAARRTTRAHAAHKQRAADEALEVEADAASAVRAALAPLGLERFDDYLARRERLALLELRAANADQAREHARAARSQAALAAERFDRLAETLVPDAGGDRAARHATASARAARKHERDGLDAHVHALELRRPPGDANDERSLLAEREELTRDGVEPLDEPTPGARRALERERNETAEALRGVRENAARLEGQIATATARIADLAGLDEAADIAAAHVARLEAFERALQLARVTLDRRTQEAHAAFARRLEDYAAVWLAAITGGRYGEIRIDPSTLVIRVRVPETGSIVDLDAMSAGTRDQVYLVVRLAMARMFAEGLETPPLLLDDPFAFWDAARIERCLPILTLAARESQAIVFTSSRELAAEAAAAGAHRIDLTAPVVAAVEV